MLIRCTAASLREASGKGWDTGGVGGGRSHCRGKLDARSCQRVHGVTCVRTGFGDGGVVIDCFLLINLRRADGLLNPLREIEVMARTGRGGPGGSLLCLLTSRK